MSKSKPSYYNFRTKQYESFVEGAFLLLEDFADYLPQDAIAKNMYNLNMLMGLSPLEAYLQAFENIVKARLS